MKIIFGILILSASITFADVSPQDAIGATIRKDSTSNDGSVGEVHSDCFATSCQGIDSDCGKLTTENVKEIEAKTPISK